MDVYPHPLVNLAIFQRRLTTDAKLTDPYQLACSIPTPLDSTVDEADPCHDWAGIYNTLVDIQAQGGYVGTVYRRYPYNRIDLGQLTRVIGPLLKGDATTLADLLPRINQALGTQLSVHDILATPIPECECACGPIGVDLQADPTSLIYTGKLRLYIHVHPLPLNTLLFRPFLAELPLPALTP